MVDRLIRYHGLDGGTQQEHSLFVPTWLTNLRVGLATPTDPHGVAALFEIGVGIAGYSSMNLDTGQFRVKPTLYVVPFNMTIGGDAAKAKRSTQDAE